MKSPAAIAVSRVFSVSLGFASTILIARLLGPSGRGISSAALAALYITPLICGLGLPLAVRRHAALDMTDEAVRAARRYALLLVPVSALIALGLLAGPLAPLSGSARVALVVGVMLTPVGVLWLVDQNVLVARHDYTATAVVLIAPPTVFLLGIALSASFGGLSVAAVLFSNSAGVLGTWAYSAYRVRTPIRGNSIPLRAIALESLSYAGSQIAEAAAVRLPQLILLPLMGASQLGLFVIGDTLASTPLAIAYALNARFYSSIALAEPTDTAPTQARAVRAGLVWSGIATVCLLAVIPVLIPLAFGRNFDAAVVPALLSTLGTIGLVTAQVASSAMAAVRRGGTMTLCQLTGLAVTVTLMATTASWGGAAAAAASAAVGSTITLLLLLIFIRIPPGEYKFNRVRAADAVRSMLFGEERRA